MTVALPYGPCGTLHTAVYLLKNTSAILWICELKTRLIKTRFSLRSKIETTMVVVQSKLITGSFVPRTKQLTKTTRDTLTCTGILKTSLILKEPREKSDTRTPHYTPCSWWKAKSRKPKPGGDSLPAVAEPEARSPMPPSTLSLAGPRCGARCVMLRKGAV